MTGVGDWQKHLESRLDQIRSEGAALSDAVRSVRGMGDVPGVAIEVGVGGEIVALRIAPGAMRWNEIQLAQAVQQCHNQARADAAAKTERLIAAASPQVQAPLRDIQAVSTPPAPAPPPPMTDAEMLAADDDYFERMNRTGWTKPG